MKDLAKFSKEKRKEAKLTQEHFADRTGVTLRVIRKLEQGKENLNLSIVTHILKLLSYKYLPVEENDVFHNHALGELHKFPILISVSCSKNLSTCGD